MYRMVIDRFDNELRWLVPTGARVVFGLIFLLEGSQKLFGWWSGSPAGSGHPEPFLNWPYWWAGVLEVIVGTLLVLGWWTRTAAILGSGAMAYAYFFTHVPTNWNPVENDGGYAATWCWGFLLLAVTAKDARYSLDRVIAQRRSSK